MPKDQPFNNQGTTHKFIDNQNQGILLALLKLMQMIRNQNEEETDNLSPWHLRNLSDLSTEFTDQKQKNQLKSNERDERTDDWEKRTYESWEKTTKMAVNWAEEMRQQKCINYYFYFYFAITYHYLYIFSPEIIFFHKYFAIKILILLCYKKN